jgi:hypothetical protein
LLLVYCAWTSPACAWGSFAVLKHPPSLIVLLQMSVIHTGFKSRSRQQLTGWLVGWSVGR